MRELSAAELDAIEARCNAATEGPWGVDVDSGYDLEGRLWVRDQRGTIVARVGQTTVPTNVFLRVPEEDDNPRQTVNAEFIAHARTDVPRLTAAVRELQGEVVWLTTENGILSSGVTCFGCGAAYSPDIANGPCDSAHRETWPHEWINQRTRETITEAAQLRAENERLRHYRTTREHEWGRAMSAVDKALGHFDEHGNILGNGQWRLREIASAVKELDAISSRLAVEDDAFKASATAPAAAGE